MEGETIQDLDRQVEVVLEKWKPEDIQIYKERGSAYDINKIHKRTEFLSLIRKLFNSNNITLDDIFTKRKKKQDINLYIYDYSRIMRNLEWSLLFSILCTLYNVTIYSYKDGVFKVSKGMTPTEKLVKYLDLGIKAYSGEEYSYNTSVNIKKAHKVEDGISISSYGKKWGVSLRYLDHTKDNPHYADIDTMRRVEKYILESIKESSYQDTINKVAERFSIKISKGYINIISRRKRKSLISKK